MPYGAGTEDEKVQMGSSWQKQSGSTDYQQGQETAKPKKYGWQNLDEVTSATAHTPSGSADRADELKQVGEGAIWDTAREFRGMIGTRQQGLQDIAKSTELGRDAFRRETGRATAGAFGNAGQVVGGGGQAAMMRDTGLAAAAQKGQFEAEQMERARLQQEALQQARIQSEQALVEAAAAQAQIPTAGEESAEKMAYIGNEINSIIGATRDWTDDFDAGEGRKALWDLAARLGFDLQGDPPSDPMARQQWQYLKDTDAAWAADADSQWWN